MDCTQIMKYSALQQKVIEEKVLERRCLADDERFLEEEIMQAKIENYKLKVKLSEAHNECKNQTAQNFLA